MVKKKDHYSSTKDYFSKVALKRRGFYDCYDEGKRREGVYNMAEMYDVQRWVYNMAETYDVHCKTVDRQIRNA